MLLADPLKPHKMATGAGIHTKEQQFLLRRHPLLNGFFLHFGRCNYQGLSADAESIFGATFSVLHIYAAVKKESAIDCHSQLLEEVIRLQGASAFFVGGVEWPRSPQGYQHQLMLDCGGRATSFASDYRGASGGRPVPRKALNELGPVSMFLQEKPNNHVSSLTASDIQTVINRTRAEPAQASSLGAVLKSLSTVLHSETSAVEFDYFHAHLECVRLLKRLDDNIARQTPRSASPRPWVPIRTVQFFFSPAGFGRLDEVARIIGN